MQPRSWATAWGSAASRSCTENSFTKKERGSSRDGSRGSSGRTRRSGQSHHLFSLLVHISSKSVSSSISASLCISECKPNSMCGPDFLLSSLFLSYILGYLDRFGGSGSPSIVFKPPSAAETIVTNFPSPGGSWSSQLASSCQQLSCRYLNWLCSLVGLAYLCLCWCGRGA